jgi:hypothetical protein
MPCIRSREPLLLALMVMSACLERAEPASDSTAAPPTPVTVALIDSVPYDDELEPGVLHRVSVTGPVGVDTIPEVLTHQLPVVQNDSLVLGFRFDGRTVRDAFAYSPATRRLEPRALPPDFVSDSWPQFSPDGRYLVYLARDSAGARYGVVLAWPGGLVRYRGIPVMALATDMGVERFVWETPRNFTLEIALEAPFRATQRTRGTISADGTVVATIDTIAPSG